MQLGLVASALLVALQWLVEIRCLVLLLAVDASPAVVAAWNTDAGVCVTPCAPVACAIVAGAGHRPVTCLNLHREAQVVEELVVEHLLALAPVSTG